MTSTPNGSAKSGPQPNPDLDAATAKRVLDADLANILKRVKGGTPLTEAQRRRVEAKAGIEAHGSSGMAPNQTALARELDVTRATIGRWRKLRGNPGVMPDGRLDIAAWRRFAQSRGKADAPSQTEARARQILLQNEKIAFDLAVRREEYVRSADVEQWGSELGTAIRKVVTQLRKLAPALAGLSVPETEARLREAETEIMGQLHSLNDHVAEMKSQRRD